MMPSCERFGTRSAFRDGALGPGPTCEVVVPGDEVERRDATLDSVVRSDARD